MGSLNLKTEARLKRKKRIRKKLFGTPERPRLTVFRSARHIYAQIIDDTTGKVLVSASTVGKEEKSNSDVAGKKTVKATAIGKLIAKRAIDKGINQVVFDRNGFRYHGRVKAISDGAREAGLNL